MSRSEHSDAMLREAVDLLIRRGIVALAWIDEDFVARWSHGALADWIRPGENICLAAAPFAGMEMRLRALQDEPRSSLLLPNVGHGHGDAPDRKVSIQAIWHEERQRYLVVVYELGPQAEIDRDVFKQLKARRLAEQNVRRAREELTEKQHLLDVLVAHAPAPVAMLDGDLRYRMVTRRWLKEFGVELEPVIGRRHDEVFPTDSKTLLQGCRDSLHGKTTQANIEAIRRPDGKTQWVRWDVQPWSRGDGGIGGVIASGDILTELIETQKQLEARNAELADLNGDLEEFASIIAHDLQAPVRSLLRKVETIRSQCQPTSDMDVQLSECLTTIQRMRTMIADLHAYSRARRQSRVVRHVNIGELVAEIAASLPAAESFDVTFAGPEGTHRFPVAPLDLVLRNLIENAIKHHDCETGRVEISLDRRATEWIFTVGDDGPGIDPRDQARIFRPFAKGSVGGTSSGSGMGLALVKKTLEAHGSAIEIHSDPARVRGTRFTFRWPDRDAENIADIDNTGAFETVGPK